MKPNICLSLLFVFLFPFAAYSKENMSRKIYPLLNEIDSGIMQTPFYLSIVEKEYDIAVGDLAGQKNNDPAESLLSTFWELVIGNQVDKASALCRFEQNPPQIRIPLFHNYFSKEDRVFHRFLVGDGSIFLLSLRKNNSTAAMTLRRTNDELLITDGSTLSQLIMTMTSFSPAYKDLKIETIPERKFQHQIPIPDEWVSASNIPHLCFDGKTVNLTADNPLPPSLDPPLKPIVTALVAMSKELPDLTEEQHTKYLSPLSADNLRKDLKYATSQPEDRKAYLKQVFSFPHIRLMVPSESLCYIITQSGEDWFSIVIMRNFVDGWKIVNRGSSGALDQLLRSEIMVQQIKKIIGQE